MIIIILSNVNFVEGNLTIPQPKNIFRIVNKNLKKNNITLGTLKLIKKDDYFINYY